MNLKHKKLFFTENPEEKKPIKNDKWLQNKPSVETINYEIKLVPPACFNSSFEDDKWFGINFNKSITSKDALNFIAIPKKWVDYTKKVLCINDQLQEHGTKKISAFGSFYTYFNALNHFFNQMEQLNLKSLREVTEEDFRKIYFNYSENKTIAANKRYLNALKKLYEYGPESHKFLEDGLVFNPLNDYLIVGNANKSKNVGETAIIDDDTALLLISTSIDWVINKKQDLLDLMELSKIHTSKKLSKDINNIKKSLTSVQARNALYDNPTLHERLLEIRKGFGKDLILFLEPGHRESKEGLEPELCDFMKINLILKRLHSIYQSFVYVICASFTGWRASEIFSINPENLKETATGYYLSSNLIKTTQNKNEIISRPIPEIVAKAVLNLQEINCKIDGLFTNKIVKKNGETTVLFRSPFGNALDLKSINEDLNVAWKYTNGHDFKFSSHQFRRFFAHFYIRRYQGSADAVRWNFRHISKDMILHYTRQAMGAKQLAQSKKELAKEIANKIVKENEYTSILVGNELKDFLDPLKLKAKVLSIEEASKYIEEKVDVEFKDIHAMEWGYCMFQNGNKGAACEAKTGPIESRSEPSTCGRCKFLCTGPENIGFWQQTIILHQDIKSNKFATKIMKTESEKLITIGSQIIKRHNKE